MVRPLPGAAVVHWFPQLASGTGELSMRFVVVAVHAFAVASILAVR
jgi:hypothetical protein